MSVFSIITAPFTPDQVDSLNGWQHNPVHPFTCGNSNCPVVHAVLVAAEDGWHCPECGFFQNWAHDFMTDWSWRPPEGILW